MFRKKKEPKYQTLQDLMNEKIAQAAEHYAKQIEENLYKPRNVFASVTIAGADKILVPVMKKLPWYRIWGPRIRDAWLVLMGKEFICRCEDEDW